MPDIIKCPCGKSQIKYTAIGEDQWYGEPENVRIEEEGYGKIVICKSCGKQIDTFDPYMVKF